MTNDELRQALQHQAHWQRQMDYNEFVNSLGGLRGADPNWQFGPGMMDVRATPDRPPYPMEEALHGYDNAPEFVITAIKCITAPMRLLWTLAFGRSCSQCHSRDRRILARYCHRCGSKL